MKYSKNTFKQYTLGDLPEAPIKEVAELARLSAREGMVLLKNTKGTLPFVLGDSIAVFGRGQREYCKSGTGSGGLVNVSYVTNILDSLLEHTDLKINQKLMDTYTNWIVDHPFDKGTGWGKEPWCQEEMEIDEQLATDVAKESQKALVILTRTAGEDKDNSNTKGSWYLSEKEEQMLEVVSKHFYQVAVVLNVGNIIDMSWVEKYGIDSVLYVWQGGMEGGRATADVLTGVVSPSGKLSDTIAKNIEDYPSNKNFGDEKKNIYQEDIYVGYRYFETFAKEKVLYPFGFGLSYTTFDVKTLNCKMVKNKHHVVTLNVQVTNKGTFEGKEVVQVYLGAPQGKLGKPEKELVAFTKTKSLKVGEKQKVQLSFVLEDFASYDDSGATGHKSSYILEGGQYLIYVGTDVRGSEAIAAYELTESVVSTCRECLAPVQQFQRFKPGDDGEFGLEPVPQRTFDIYERIFSELPKEIPFTADKGIKLLDVKNKKATMEDFIAQLEDIDLIHLCRGEGMSSPKVVTPGTGSCFGGLTDKLVGFGIPIATTTDGPSGLRMDSGLHATSLPNGTMIACSWNLPLTYELFLWEGIELIAYKIDCLLGPGINIHRHPLNGRNFEYFSEDPFLTGRMAASMCAAMDEQGVTCTIKHFAANNQEWHRHDEDSIVSERALREIYLKPFEIAVIDGNVQAIMTSYNMINGLHGASCYDLTTSILRNEWGYKGFVMTDWWAKTNREGGEESRDAIGPMIQAQNDVYMVCPDVTTRKDGAEEELKQGYITRSQLQTCAKNILSFLMNTHAMERFIAQGSKYSKNEAIDVTNKKQVLTVTIPEKATKIDIELPKEGKQLVEICYHANTTVLAQIPISFIWNAHKVGFVMVQGTEDQTSKIAFRLALDSKQGTLAWASNNGALIIDELHIYED